MANYILLERIELNASAASVTFANIPQTGYTDLKVVASARFTNAAISTGMAVRFNGVGTNQSARFIQGNGAAASSFTDTTIYGDTDGANATANTFSSFELYVPNYTSSNNKSVSIDNVMENNATTAYSMLEAGLWSSSAAITSITFQDYSASASFVANSTFSLYGLAATGTTPTIAPKASGGNRIDYDGTYWIHTFNTNGTFTPQIGLTCDVLVVAGGGGTPNTGGGGTNVAGGAGAGGLVYQASRSIASSFTVTVGGGGAINANGNDSIFDTITANGGGKGGTELAFPGNGGSGGGSTWAASYNTAGTATQGNSGGGTGYGFAGGTNTVGAGSGNYPSGGGGGAGAVGGAGSGATKGGDGGIGRAYSITGSSTYYAGGGGGSSWITATVKSDGGLGGGGQGGCNSGGLNVGTSGTANTGGGAGASTGGGAGQTGGSGVVIIRYPAA
jgi:hypothetical protein